MAADVVDGHVAHLRSGQKLDPRCEPCFDTEKRMVDVSIYCNECFQFMCSDCHYYHDKLPFTKNHDVLQGSRMPKSLADKPPKYEGYGEKSEQMVCDNQKTLLRSACSGSDLESRLIHTRSTGDVAKTDKHPQSDALLDPVKNVNDKAYSLKVSIENNLGELEKLLEETRNFHGRMSARVNELYQVIQSETDAIETLSQKKHHKVVQMKEQPKQAAEIQNANQPSPTCANPFDGMGDSEAPDPLSRIKATKQNQYDTCSADMVFITGMAVTKDKRRLLVDHEQCKVTVFSPEMKYSDVMAKNPVLHSSR